VYKSRQIVNMLCAYFSFGKQFMDGNTNESYTGPFREEIFQCPSTKKALA
jgi:hypothetical protein